MGSRLFAVRFQSDVGATILIRIRGSGFRVRVAYVKKEETEPPEPNTHRP